MIVQDEIIQFGIGTIFLSENTEWSRQTVKTNAQLFILSIASGIIYEWIVLKKKCLRIQDFLVNMDCLFRLCLGSLSSNKSLTD